MPSGEDLLDPRPPEQVAAFDVDEPQRSARHQLEQPDLEDLRSVGLWPVPKDE